MPWQAYVTFALAFLLVAVTFYKATKDPWHK